ncbi:hypothetical protein M408DRAFT_331430 [Serendipita vermifera MAFF 305830]|uniref:VWFA domain-containing protein n=1 Tax=Serendipita vermifera MAFF 305830 TaxID=933852 RepID=A0A0C2X6M5_SERVB|nr:hypothetical protein M408DRAFT_331430 [Serendipita vermifera MAFF 305830]
MDIDKELAPFIPFDPDAKMQRPDSIPNGGNATLPDEGGSPTSPSNSTTGTEQTSDSPKSAWSLKDEERATGQEEFVSPAPQNEQSERDGDMAGAPQAATDQGVDASTRLLAPAASDPNDLLTQIPGMYRLLDLRNDDGSSGIVDKVVIDQDSVAKFANAMRRGSYRSTTNVDFHSLDKAVIKPLGVYGSIPALTKFLDELKLIKPEIQSLLIAPRTEHSGVSIPTLRPGIYLLEHKHAGSSQQYVIFWPEDTTWQDNSISSVARNRVAFMRYMTKLCEQLVCLISEEHSTKLIWRDKTKYSNEIEDTDEAQYGDGSSDLDAYDRLFSFSVQQTNAETETAVAKLGFSVPHSSLCTPPIIPPGVPTGESPASLGPQLIVGDTSQAILKIELLPEHQKVTHVNETVFPMALRSKLSPSSAPTILLSKTLDKRSLDILLQHGLWWRCGPELESQWKAQLQADERKREEEKKSERGERLHAINRRVSMLKASMPFYLVDIAMALYPILHKHKEELLASIRLVKPEVSQEEDDSIRKEVVLWLAENSAIVECKRKEIEADLKVLSNARNDPYKRLKNRLRRVVLALEETPGLSTENIQRLVNLINLEPKFAAEILKVINDAQAQDSKGFLQTLKDSVTDTLSKINPLPTSTEAPPLTHLEDTEFGVLLESLVADNPVFGNVASEIKRYMLERLQEKCKKLENIAHDIGRPMQNSMDVALNQKFESRAKKETSIAWESLKCQIQEKLASKANLNAPTLTIERVTLVSHGYFSRSYDESFKLEAKLSSLQMASLRYTILPLEVKSDDIDQSSKDRNFVCQPVIRPNAPPPFVLPLNAKIRLIRLIGKDLCLIVLQTDEHLEVYLDQIGSLHTTITSKKSKKQINVSRVGVDCILAVDEAKRLLAILSCHSGSILIHIYTYDIEARAFIARGGSVNITRWYDLSPNLPTFTQMVFIAGTEEILLIEDSGSCRIYSLVTENFRPSSLKIEEPVRAASSSPDGACLFLSTGNDEGAQVRCFHWASFGSNQGIELDIPEDIPMRQNFSVSSVGHKKMTYLLFLDTANKVCRSLLIQITCKSSDFMVHSDLNEFEYGRKPELSINNSLIDCHAEVWTRYPVYGGAIKRETSPGVIHQVQSILFISSAPTARFSQYFASLIDDFETKTRKPTRGLLKQIKIVSLPAWPSDGCTSIETSQFPLGEWLVGMFCLIPIHLAVTNSNRFNPLKDGMTSPEFEKSLLGANVIQIAQALSFGWYESIFASYLAKKPVKVVTSMGEQSVGKSFALNHFVDTSFAGSAMRCTEGVWLSVTPTRDYVVVAMDFEGVHSIERSAQEDTLLVLLNAAISNFVLFRNNFAMSRDIAGLFTSFQSSTNVLDTASNERLFNGTLGIIIKDVIDSDTKEIVNEFRQKFQRIVQQEQGDNFISKLHNGKFNIIPWPVIESARFYELFGVLKRRLDRQPLTHRHAGAFIGDLKMLMAKLKANDWGALDVNLVMQRTKQLSVTLALAMAFGTTDPSIREPLKHFDTDEAIPGSAHEAIFYLDAAAGKGTGSDYSLSASIAQLRKSFPGYFKRFEMDEEEFFRRLTVYLQSLANSRIEHVNEWIKINTERFGEKLETIKLFHESESLAKELKASVALCGSKCSMCGLLCVLHKVHEGGHDCKTSHKCPQICSFVEEHAADACPIPDCSMPAAHSGTHICSEKPHLCRTECFLHKKDGCLKSCSKPSGHDDDEGHICAAKVHACGEPCSLVRPDGVPICTRHCVIDCNREHQQHACDRSMSCPIQCQLCSSICAVGDHFHALQDDAVHLCGQTHACRELCEQPGICRIATAPQSIECTFTGRHSQFQFTKYTQEAERLHCVVRINADEVNHKGPHQHSLDAAAFHYCKERCKHCGYYCTLPLNHSQNQHDTSHGSMSQTTWVVEGDADSALELQGRKYATGDSGAPMLCSMICKTLGRHVHIDRCRLDGAENCVGGAEIEHVQRQRGTTLSHDWITHRLFWARSGFKDPYTNAEQADFDLCDHRCGGEEHDPDLNQGAAPSNCVLPLFHPPADATTAPVLGHTSLDGHAYQCKNPALMQRAFHIFFALDRSGSMSNGDRRPLPDSPATLRIVQRANNRFGAVVSSLYGFWTARDAAIRSGTAGGMRRDAYTIIPFNSTASTLLTNDTISDPDRLLETILRQGGGHGGTNFTHALQTVQREMERTWATERYPIVIFLSDGQCRVADSVIYDLCRRAVTLGRPLSFHAVSFGTDTYSNSLRRMVAVAGEVYAAAPRDPLAPPGNPCTFSAALDTIQLADTFMSIAASLKKPRAALSRV